jgi:hypothetical protein
MGGSMIHIVKRGLLQMAGMAGTLASRPVPSRVETRGSRSFLGLKIQNDQLVHLDESISQTIDDPIGTIMHWVPKMMKLQ